MFSIDSSLLVLSDKVRVDIIAFGEYRVHAEFRIFFLCRIYIVLFTDVIGSTSLDKCTGNGNDQNTRIMIPNPIISVSSVTFPFFDLCLEESI